MGGFGDGAEHEDDVGMPILGKHVDLVVKLLEQLLADVGVEDLLDGHVQLEVPAFVDGAESSHRDLLSLLQVAYANRHHSVDRLPLWLEVLRLYLRLSEPARSRCQPFVLLEPPSFPCNLALFLFFNLFLLHQPTRRFVNLLRTRSSL